LLNIVGTPTAEYSQTWPHREEVQKSELIDKISKILSDAVNKWNNSSLELPIELVNQQIIDQLVADKYVTYHHNQTTRRDYGGFYGSH
jgi:phenylpyruvate tautomerase PptA (4-oxalocrotonate tautomerase family)